MPAPIMKNTRRQFLRHTFATCSALSLTSGITFAAQKQKPQWKTAVGLNGFQSGSRKYKKNYPIWEIAEFASREGFDGVELVWDWPMGPYPEATEKTRVEALRKFWERYHLQIFSIQLGADGAFHTNPDTRKRWLDTFADRIQLAHELGCACVGLWPYGALGEQTVDQAIEHLGRSFSAAATMAQKFGILAAFEIEPPFAFNREEHYVKILAVANHPNLKGIYDPSHFDLMTGSTGRPHEMLQRVGVKNIGYVQFTDGDGTLRDGGTSKHMACGDGHIDVETSLKVLRDGGFSGWIMIDEWEVPDPYDACVKGLKAIRKACT